MLRRLTAEAIGSAVLAAAVIGSGIMAQRLAGGNAAVALIANTFATVAVLFVLIRLLAPISGAHFNPAVSLVMAISGRQPWNEMAAYAVVQVVACCFGAVLAHAMFELPLLQASTHARTGLPQWLGEFVATGGLLLVVLCQRVKDDAAKLVAAWIGAAYWFTSSTSFANPAITIARSLTDTFAGIRAIDVAPFVMAQTLGALVALGVSRAIFDLPSGEEGPASPWETGQSRSSIEQPQRQRLKVGE